MLRIIGLQERVAAQEEEDLQTGLVQTSRRQAFNLAIRLRPATVEALDIPLRMDNTIHNSSSSSSSSNNNSSRTSRQEASTGEDSLKAATIPTTHRGLTVSE